MFEYQENEREQLCEPDGLDWTAIFDTNNINDSWTPSLSASLSSPLSSPETVCPGHNSTESNGALQSPKSTRSSLEKQDGDMDRQTKRKLQNREAQRKCRDRRKDKTSQLAEQLRNSVAQNKRLQSECAKLKSECHRLQSINGVYMELLQTTPMAEPSAHSAGSLPYGHPDEVANWIPWPDESDGHW